MSVPMCVCLNSFPVLMPGYQQTWGRLFEINDVVSLRFVKISNVNIANPLLFFVEKNVRFSHFFNKKQQWI